MRESVKAFLLLIVVCAPFRIAAQPEVLEGRLLRLAVDELNPKSKRLSGRTHTYVGVGAGLYEVENPAAVSGIRAGSRVRIEAARSDGSLRIQTATSLRPGLRAEVNPAIGAQKTLTALFYFPDAPAADSYTLPDIKNAILNDSRSVNNFIKEASYNQTWLLADPGRDFVDWRPLPKSYREYSRAAWTELARDSIAAIDAEVDFTGYGRLIFIYSHAVGNESAAGWALMGQTGWDTGEGDILASYASIFSPSTQVLSHEFGHNLELYHAGGLNCHGAPHLMPQSILDPYMTCANIPLFDEYDDYGDTMGFGYGHFSAVGKARPKWIEDPQIQDVTASGDYTLDQFELPSSGKKTLRVFLGEDYYEHKVHYWIEYRQPLGAFDASDRIQVRTNPLQINAALSSSSSASVNWASAQSLRYHDGSFELDPYVDAYAARPFVDPYRGLKVELLSKSGSGAATKAAVRVTIGALRASAGSFYVYPQTLVGENTAKSFTIANGGSSAVTISSVTIGGRHSSDFSISANRCGAVLNPGAWCEVEALFSPKSGSDRLAWLQIENSDPVGPKLTVALAGRGHYSARAAASPTDLDFGYLAPRTESEVKTVTVNNTGNREMQVSRLWSSDPDELSAVNDGCTNVNVQPGGSCTFGLRFKPWIAGERTQDLQIVYNAVNTPWPRISGHALGSAGPPGDYTLTVAKSGSGSESAAIWSVDGKVSCGATCSHTYRYVQEVVLHAYVPDGYELVSWSGCDEVSGTICVVTTRGDHAVQIELKRIGESSGAIRLTAPNGGETWRPGKKGLIAWTCVGKGACTAKVNLIKGGRKVKTLAKKAPSRNKLRGAFRWKVPKKIKSGYDYQVEVARVKCKDCIDRSDGWFVIAKMPLATPQPTATPAPPAPPIPTPTAAARARSLSLAIFGLGQSILVTDQSQVTIGGRTSSDVGVSSVEVQNVTTGVAGLTSGTDTWSSQLALQLGDNQILVTAFANDGETSTSLERVLTYFPGMSFLSPLTLSTDVAYINEVREVTAAIALPRAVVNQAPVVKLLSVSESGQFIAEAGAMIDDGLAPDERKVDGVYTLGMALNYPSAGRRCWRVSLTAAGSTYYSEKRCLDVFARYSTEHLRAAALLGGAVQSRFDALLQQGNTRSETAQIVLAEFQSDPVVGAIGSGPDGALWWVTSQGILSGYYPPREGSRGGGGEPAASSSPPLEQRLFPARRAGGVHYYPQALRASRLGLRASAAATPDPNALHGNRAVIISPFVDNTAFRGMSGWNFDSNDDLYHVWNRIWGKDSCILYAAASAANVGASSIGPTTFKDIAPFAYVHVSSHGNVFYKGAQSRWREVWGPKEWLDGDLEQVAVFTGWVVGKKTDGAWDLGGLEDDLQAKRIALMMWPDAATVAILPGFIRYYIQDMPNSLVALSTCYSLYNDSMANAFLDAGAGAVLGYTDSVNSPYAWHTVDKVLARLFETDRLLDAYYYAVAEAGVNDDDDTPAEFRMAGNNNLKLSAGGLQNGGFESGDLTPWEIVTNAEDAAVTDQFGSVAAPSDDGWMAYLGSGACSQDEVFAGAIRQAFCMPLKAKTLSFDYNVVSAYFSINCSPPPDNPAAYQEEFHVQIGRLDNVTGEYVDGTFRVLLHVRAPQLCSAAVPFGYTLACYPFDPALQSGFRSSGPIDVSDYAGRNVYLGLATLNGGIELHDTVTLLDNVMIEEQ